MIKRISTFYIVLFSFQFAHAMWVGVPAPTAPPAGAPVTPVPLSSLDQQLFDAVDKNNIDLVDELLARGANINATDEFLRTPLHYAAQNEQDDTVQALLFRRANPNIRDTLGITPLMYAAMNGNLYTANLLCLNNANINNQDDIGRTALIVAASKGYRFMTQFLLSQNADKTLRTFTERQTAYDYAIEAGHTFCANLVKP